MTAPAHALPFEEPLVAPSGVRLLVIDDDPRVCRAIANAMSRVGFHVFTADDGPPALEITEQVPPDIAIVDYSMPMPGPLVVRRLRATHGSAIHIAVLSGHDDEATRAACFDAGADAVLAKPVHMDELRSLMVAAARARQAHVEARIAAERVERRRAYGAEAAAMLAHDLNGGLAAALASLSQLDGAAGLGEAEAAALAAAVRSLRRMSGLVANFVDIARFEDAGVKPQASTNNLRALLHEVVEVHAGRAARFEIDCDPALAGRFDLALIERVLHNLVGNAIRHCTAGGAVRLSARRWDPLAPWSVELSVWNSGPPVPAALRDHLFEQPAQDGAGKPGRGLYFCRLACEAHGGTIAYAPTSGGPTFSVRLPGRA